MYTVKIKKIAFSYKALFIYIWMNGSYWRTSLYTMFAVYIPG